MISDYNNSAAITGSKKDLAGVIQRSGQTAGMSSSNLDFSGSMSTLSAISAGFASSVSGAFKDLTAVPPVEGDVNLDKRPLKKMRTKKLRMSLFRGLFQIVTGVIKIPTRFDKIFMAFKESTLGVVKGIEGIGKSIALSIYDLGLLAYNLLIIIFKYTNCLISFIITLPMCFVIHIITFVFTILYLIFPLTAFLLSLGTGGMVNLNPAINTFFQLMDTADDSFASISGFNLTKWPPLINKICYTCNGKVVKLKDVFRDMGNVIKVGIKISTDVTRTMPRYMRKSMPHLVKTQRYLRQVFR
jgi:hypothetical protein